MEKPKTMQEIAKCPTCHTCKDEKCVNYYALQAEAIEWLLYAIKKGKNPFKAFMDFHNLTEEDLG